MNVINKKKLLNLVVLLAIFFFTSGVVDKAHAAISFIGATPDTTPTSINVPAGYQAGDVMIAVFSIDRASTTTDPAITATGWTAINSVANTNGGSTSPRTLTAAYWKIAGASETSYNFSITSEGVGAILVYRGVDNSNPTTGTATGQSVGSAASLQNSYSAASITTGFANSWLVHVTGVESTTTKNFTVPSGWTNERVDTGSTTPDTWIGVSDFQQNSAGASGAKAATLTSAATAFGSTVMFALRPENVAPSITVSPTASYPQYTRTGANNTPWQLTFTATDPEQTGANALTYYVHTGANRTGTQIATATFTSGTGVDTTVAYNATGMASGTNTLYLSVYDGQSYSSNPTFTVLRDDAAPSSAGTISTTPNPVGDDNIYSVTFTPTDALSTATNEIRYWITTTSGAPNGTEVTTGGTAIANGENLPNEGKDKAFDDNTGTKWLVFATTGYIGYDFSAETTEVVNRYTLTSGNDSPDRDPKNWDFQGSNNGTDWTTLDSQTNQVFASRAQTKEYNFANTTPYKMYRLNITANNGSSNIIQLAELSMYKNANGLTYGTSTSGAQKTTSTFTDSTLTDGATRYVRLCDGASNCADFSFTVAKGNPPVVSTLGTTNLTPYTATLNAQADPIGVATTGYFRYWTSDPGSCTDSGGTRAPSSSGSSLGSGNGNIAYNQNITGLTPGTTYYYCAIADNGSKGYGTISNFTAPGGGQCSSVPQSGSYAISSSCVFSDSSNDGLDNGSGTTNNALMTINATKTLTVGPGQVLGHGGINKSGATIIKFGGGVIMKAPIWVPDADEDGYPDSTGTTGQVVSFTKPSGYARRAATDGLAADCGPANVNTYRNVASLATDADQDGYYTGSPSTQCVGSSTVVQVNVPIPSGVIIAWPSTSGSIPSGWSRVTALDNRFLKGVATAGTNPGSTGGSATHSHGTPGHVHGIDHTHTYSGSLSGGSGTNSFDDGIGGTTSSYGALSHTHSVSGSITTATVDSQSASPGTDTDSNDPNNLSVIWIESNGTPTSIPNGALAFFSTSSLPSGYSLYTNSQNRFLKGASGGGNGGSTANSVLTNHNHTVSSHTHSGTSHGHADTLSVANGGGTATYHFGSEVGSGSITAATTSHSHNLDVDNGSASSLSSGSGNASGNASPAEPPYVKLATIEKTSGTGYPSGLVTVWRGTIASIPSGWVISNGANGTLNTLALYVKGAASTGEIGNTGGNLNTHTHTAPSGHTHTTSGHSHGMSVGGPFSGTTLSNVNPGNATNAIAAPHDHTVGSAGSTTPTVESVTAGALDAQGTEPQFYTVAYLQSTSAGGTVDITYYKDSSGNFTRVDSSEALGSGGGAAIPQAPRFASSSQSGCFIQSGINNLGLNAKSNAEESLPCYFESVSKNSLTLPKYLSYNLRFQSQIV